MAGERPLSAMASQADQGPAEGCCWKRDINEITQLVLHERQGRDRGWWEQMAASFHPDSQVSLSWFNGTGADFTTRSRVMSESGLWPLHRLSPPTIHINGVRAFAELPAAIVVRFPIDGVEAELTSYSRLLYTVERRTEWKIRSLSVVYERDTLTPAVPGTSLDIDPESFSSFRTSYRCLSYHMSLRGIEPPADLYGDDQPERSRVLYDEILRWLAESRLDAHAASA